MRSVLAALICSDNSARQAGAMHSIALRKGRYVLTKSVSSAYSMSRGSAVSAGGRGGSRLLRSLHT